MRRSTFSEVSSEVDNKPIVEKKKYTEKIYQNSSGGVLQMYAENIGEISECIFQVTRSKEVIK